MNRLKHRRKAMKTFLHFTIKRKSKERWMTATANLHRNTVWPYSMSLYFIFTRSRNLLKFPLFFSIIFVESSNHTTDWWLGDKNLKSRRFLWKLQNEEKFMKKVKRPKDAILRAPSNKSTTLTSQKEANLLGSNRVSCRRFSSHVGCCLFERIDCFCINARLKY